MPTAVRPSTARPAMAMPVVSARATRLYLLLALFVSGSLFSNLAAAEGIYRWTDAEGNTVYSDQRQCENAKPAAANSNRVNYYSAPKTSEANSGSGNKAEGSLSRIATDAYDTLATLEAVPEDTELEAVEKLSEAECQEQYQRSCDQVSNWRKYALEACGNDSRCSDEAFLDRKYRPRTQAELREIARRAAVRRGQIEDKIDEFLSKKFSNRCENQARLYCSERRQQGCLQTMIAQCEDPRSLKQVLAKYDHLSPHEQRAIIDKAKKMALAKGDGALDYDQLIASLVDILITSTLMGL